MVGLLITWLVTTVSFLIVSKLPIGVEIDSFGKAAISAVVFGILNAILRLVLGFLTLSVYYFDLSAIPVYLECARLWVSICNSTRVSLALWILNRFDWCALPQHY